MFDVNELGSIKLGLASPEKIISVSHGEVTKPETINYRSQKPEMDGLFCEKIFGPSKDYECHCGKYKKSRYAGVVCEKCGVEVISKEVRRERMGHIHLACPVSHIWYLKGTPSRMSLILDIPAKELEEVVYFSAHVVLNPGTCTAIKYKEVLDDHTGREKFKDCLQQIIDDLTANGEEDSFDTTKAKNLLENLNNNSIPFDYYTCAKFISKKTGAQFGEGAEAVQILLKEVDLEKEFNILKEDIKKKKGQELVKCTKRLEAFNAFIKSGNKPEWMVLDYLPVIPPDLRPMLQLDGGRFAASDANDLYRRIITKNNRLKTFIERNAPEVMIINEKRMIQEAVDALIDNGRRNGKPVTGPNGRPLKSLSAALKGKQGRFRQNLLGKRVDYSGRSVIAIGPKLKIYQCGLPREMAINLLRPFISAILIDEGICNVNRQADKKIDNKDKEVYDIVERIISHHPVLLNRAPTLHRLGIQAFQPVLVEGRAIRLHPLVCSGFNADFDGDQMAVHVPLGKAAQEEAINLMLASNNILAPKDGKPIVTPSQDILIGNYYLTMEADEKEFLKKANKYEEVGDLVEKEKYEYFAKMEGKVFRDIDETLKCYELGKIHLHNRIALPATALRKNCFTEEQNKCYLITTVGKVIFNLIFPKDFPYINSKDDANLIATPASDFVPKGTNIKEFIKNRECKEAVEKKYITKVIDSVYHRYGTMKTSAILDKIKDYGYKYSTISGLTVAYSDISEVPLKNELVKHGDEKINKIETLYDRGLLTDQERHEKVISVWNEVNSKVGDEVEKSLKNDTRNPLYIMWHSGARGSKSNYTQLMGMRGLMGSASGDTIEIPVKSCFRDGLNVAEFFTGTHGARKGGADTALKTADSGYLTRRLVDVSQDVIVREEDCHSDHGSIVSDIVDTSQDTIIVKLYDRLVGRFSCHNIFDPKTGELLCEENTLIDEEKAKAIVDAGIKEVEIRSLFGCKTKDGVCQHCYGRNLATGKIVEKGEAVGIMAAQSIGEPGTQLTMRTFHTGGVATGEDITQGLPRVQELFEARNPKGEATISEISGVVEKITDDAGHYTVKITNEKESKEYDTIYGARLRVKEGQYIENGGKITEGAIAPKKLLECSDPIHVENYIIKEVQKVYRSQGIGISDKHIEVIVKQMLRKVLIIDSGDTDLISGTKVSIVEFTEKNKAALLEGKNPAVCKPLVLGITKAALETDSFLSGASFQETTKVLTDAAIKGKIDPLHGLKENVITGKLIPAGRGLLDNKTEAEKLANFNVIDAMREVKSNYIGIHDKNSETESEIELEHKYDDFESLVTENLYIRKEKVSPISNDEIEHDEIDSDNE